MMDEHLGQIQAALPGIPITEVLHIPEGLTNDVVVVNGEFVFRFPKDEDARKSLQREVALLELVRRYVSLPVPTFEGDGGEFVLYRFLAGKPLYRHALLRLDLHDQDRLAGQLGEFLHQLHSIPSSEIVKTGYTDGWRNLEFWHKRYQDLQRELFPFLWADQMDWIDDLFAPVLDGTLDIAGQAPALTHGDLACYHILYNNQKPEVTGVIDFGSAGMDDPAVDFAFLINSYGESFLRRVARVYPAMLDSLERARFYASALELDWALAGLRSNEFSWFFVHLGRARDALPFGVGKVF